MATSLPSKLTLDPADARWADMLAQWQDGEEYDVTMRIRQDSMGNFTPLSVSEAAEPEEENEPAEEAPEEIAEEKPSHPIGKKYPRIAVLIGGKDK